MDEQETGAEQQAAPEAAPVEGDQGSEQQPVEVDPDAADQTQSGVPTPEPQPPSNGDEA